MRYARDFQIACHKAADEGAGINPNMDGGRPPEPPSNPHRDYLGDSVYADFDGYAITLTTDNGYGATNTIYLEPAVLEALDRYRKRVAQIQPSQNEHSR